MARIISAMLIILAMFGNYPVFASNKTQLFLLYGSTKGFDLASTEYALGKNPGAYEMNPLGRSGGLRLRLGLVTVTGEVILTRKLEKRHKGLAKVVKILVPLAHVGLGVWNVRQAGKR